MLTAPLPTSPATLPTSSDSRFVQIALETLFSGRFAVWYRKGGLSMTQTERRRFFAQPPAGRSPRIPAAGRPGRCRRAEAAAARTAQCFQRFGQGNLHPTAHSLSSSKRPCTRLMPSSSAQEPGCPPPPGSPTPGNDSEHISPILPANTALRICIPAAFTLTPPWRNTGRTGAGTFISTAIRTPQRPAVHLFWLRLDGRF